MNARQLEVFRMVMRCGTVTAAAEALNVSQPALSQILLHTEDSLGFKLFERSKGRLQPTAEARELFPEVDRIFGDLEGLRGRVRDMRQGKTGAIRLAASAPPSLSFVPRALAQLRDDQPDLPVLSYLLPVEGISAMLERGQASIGVAMTDQSTPFAEAEVIGQVRIACVLPERHELCELERISLRDLRPEPVITYRRGTLPRRLIERALASDALDLRPDMEIDMSFSALAFVQQGLGVALVDDLVPWQSYSGLVTRPFDPLVNLPISLLTNPRYPISLNHQSLAAHLKKACNDLGFGV